jgi:hypothetical protein
LSSRGLLLLFLIVASPVWADDKPGSGVDSQGRAVIDPTENVKALSEAAQKRQDDLRNLGDIINEQRAGHLKEIMTLRAEYEDKLRTAEAKRIDAIRLVDSNSISVANERAVATATALAKTVQDSAQVLSAQATKSADDLRQLVSTTAAESNRNLQQKFEDITKRISALEQAGAEGIGKQKFQDPATAALIEEVRKLSRAQSDSAGVGIGRGEILGGIGVVLTLLLGAFVAFRPSRR